MAPAQVIERKDLPPEVSTGRAENGEALPAKPVLTAAPEAQLKDVPTDAAAHGTVGHESEDLSHVLARAAAAHGPLEGWEAELETEAVALLGSGQPRGVGHAHASLRVPPDSGGAGQYQGPSHRGRAQAGHRPQHHHPQDPGARIGVIWSVLGL